ncbi:MAG: hypothetical protein ACPGVA_04025 [Pikeienuella sp.]
MTISISNIANALSPLRLKKSKRNTPTHETMLPEHERRKGEELRRRMMHGQCFIGAQRMC